MSFMVVFNGKKDISQYYSKTKVTFTNKPQNLKMLSLEQSNMCTKNLTNLPNFFKIRLYINIVYVKYYAFYVSKIDWVKRVYK